MATRAQAIAEAEKGKSRSAAASGETKKNAFDKKAGRVSATKAGRVDPKSGMESDVYYAFAFTGFPGDTDEVEAVNLIKEYANDFLGDFNVQVVGSNAAKGQIALTFLASEGEALAANVHAQRDKFVYRGHTLSTMAVDTLEIAAFKFPEVPPAVHPLSGDLPGASHAVPLGQLPPVSTPARRAASEMELSPELKAKVLATLKAKQSHSSWQRWFGHSLGQRVQGGARGVWHRWCFDVDHGQARAHGLQARLRRYAPRPREHEV